MGVRGSPGPGALARAGRGMLGPGEAGARGRRILAGWRLECRAGGMAGRWDGGSVGWQAGGMAGRRRPSVWTSGPPAVGPVRRRAWAWRVLRGRRAGVEPSSRLVRGGELAPGELSSLVHGPEGSTRGGGRATEQALWTFAIEYGGRGCPHLAGPEGAAGPLAASSGSRWGRARRHRVCRNGRGSVERCADPDVAADSQASLRASDQPWTPAAARTSGAVGGPGSRGAPWAPSGRPPTGSLACRSDLENLVDDLASASIARAPSGPMGGAKTLR